MNKIVIYGKKGKSLDVHTIFVDEVDFLGTPFEGQSQEIAIQEIHRIESYKIDNLTIPEKLIYENISFWWLLYLPLIQEIMKTIKFIIHFTQFLERTEPQSIKIVDGFSNFSLIKKICEKRGIMIDYSRKNFTKYKTRKRLWLFAKKHGSNKITNKKITTRKNLFFKLNQKIPEIQEKHVFVVPPRYRQSIFNLNSMKGERGEWLIHDLISLLDNQKNTVAIDVFTHVRANEEVLIERLNSDLAWFPIELIFESRKNKNEHKLFLKKYYELIISKRFQNLFEYKEIPFWDQVSHVFNKMEESYYFPYYLKLSDSLNQYFNIHKPKSIFMPYEYGPLGLCFIAAAKKNNIKTLGIAHSVIVENMWGYSHNVFATKVNPSGFPLPNFILLFGNASKKILVKQGYPSNQLITFGKPNYFQLEKIKKNLKKKNIFEKYNIPSTKKIIMFTSQMLQANYSETGGTYDLDTQIWEKILKNFSNHEDYFVILKPHPREKNIQIYEKLIKKYDPSNAKIIQDDLFELIHLSDVVLSVYSNALLDALCFGKIALRVKFGEYFHPIFDKSDAVVTVSITDLPAKLNEILNNKDLVKQLKEKGKILVNEQLNIPADNPKSVLEKILEENPSEVG